MLKQSKGGYYYYMASKTMGMSNSLSNSIQFQRILIAEEEKNK